MNIIFIAHDNAKPRQFSFWQLFAVVISIMIATAWLSVKWGKNQATPTVTVTASYTPHEKQEDIDALAIQLGEIQAQVTYLSNLSERLSHISGIKIEKGRPLGRGGPEIFSGSVSYRQIKDDIDQLSLDIKKRTQDLGELEGTLLASTMAKNMLPDMFPVDVPSYSSGYGRRLDPFTGHNGFHEGLDFPAEVGTSIYASADGIVKSAEQIPEYGNMIRIYHGNDIETRYAHISKMLVQKNALIKKGQLIALIGNTGRSTGPHLHFEIRVGEQALDPIKFLRQSHQIK